jgi:predicted lipid-binding transport protein (Tim44 family)
MGDGFQILELIFFSVVAVFLVRRLRRVLGRRTGKGQRRDPFASGPAANESTPPRELPRPLADLAAKPAIGSEAPSPLAAGIARIRQADPSFGESQFAAGARAAFEMIVHDFAAADMATLRHLLNDEVFANFSAAIERRRTAGLTLSTTLVGIRSLDIIEADLQDRNAVVTAKIVSDQIKVTQDAQGKTVEGNSTAVAAITDIWTFSRNTRSRDPNWVLVATGSQN